MIADHLHDREPATPFDAPDDEPPDEDPHRVVEPCGSAAAAPADPAEPPRRLAVDDAQLVAWVVAVAEHDERAISALYDATFARVYSLVLRIVRSPALAEEVVEETYFQVWRQAVRFDATRGSAITWLLSMARSRAIDTLRHEMRFQHDDLDDAEAACETHDPRPLGDELLDASRQQAELHRALMLLGAQPRQLVSLAFFRGLSHEEIAEQTQLPLGTVKSTIRRALNRLREMLSQGGLPALIG